jgi:cystathionine beta-synthase
MIIGSVSGHCIRKASGVSQRADSVVSEIGSLVGGTPILKLNVRPQRSCLYLKLEKFNPGQSVKDRTALSMVLGAESKGVLRPGDTIIESSSGNTGVALAMIAASRGYHFICVVDNHTTEEKINLLKAYGAEVERVGIDLPVNYHAAAERIQRLGELRVEYPSAFFIDQGENPDNPRAHYEQTAVELLESVGSVDRLVVSVGTGGSISGIARRLKESGKKTKICAVEPTGSVIFGKPYAPFYQSGSGSAKVIFGNVDFSVIDEYCQVSDAEAFETARFLARRLGILVGGSGGSVVYQSLKYCDHSDETIVALVADGGERYITTIFDDEWMADRDLLRPDIAAYLGARLERPRWQPGVVS